ncbi:DUF1963 domain-containing protein [Streptomyces sp. NPDC088747]|uniref:DUF1963 domain-containing protein n=1 Tax=Streptomyces sp. NPDC088747 TaxID=3365886 RepID=UPI0037F59073
MSYTDEFRAFARRHGVSDDAITRILWTVRPSTHLGMVRPGAIRPEHHVVGRIGGLPDLPLDTPWENGEYFVADIDLSAIPRQPLYDGLPREGRLLLFSSVDYHGAGDDPARVVHVPPGTPTALRPAPVYEGSHPMFVGDVQKLVEPRVLVLDSATGWDVLDWLWNDPYAEWNEEEATWIAQLGAAIEEYRARVGETPVVEQSTGHLGGVEMNPPYWRADYGREFLRRREEAVITLRDAPERFDELYALALEQASEQEDGLWVNLLEFGEDSLHHTGDGEVGWIIERKDLLAQRFDRVRHSYNC